VKMSNSPGPIVRTLIVCSDIVVAPEDDKRVSLLNILNTIRSTDVPPYPLLFREFCIFAQMTECRVSMEVWIEIRKGDAQTGIFSTRKRQISFPNDPLRLYGLRFRIRNCLFPSPELYWIQLWCDGQVLAQQPLILS